jgi:hypothetical protein
MLMIRLGRQAQQRGNACYRQNQSSHTRTAPYVEGTIRLASIVASIPEPSLKGSARRLTDLEARMENSRPARQAENTRGLRNHASDPLAALA